MNEFKNYKKDANGLKGFCQMIFGTRVQRIFLSSFIAFVFGVVLTTGVLSLSHSGRVYPKKKNVFSGGRPAGWR